MIQVKYTTKDKESEQKVKEYMNNQNNEVLGEKLFEIFFANPELISIEIKKTPQDKEIIVGDAE